MIKMQQDDIIAASKLRERLCAWINTHNTTSGRKGSWKQPVSHYIDAFGGRFTNGKNKYLV